jgi:hypothetical protein
MGCSREGFDLFTQVGRHHFKKHFPNIQWSLVWEDTFTQIWCWIVGHNVYNSACVNEPSEYACKRCHKYIAKLRRQT